MKLALLLLSLFISLFANGQYTITPKDAEYYKYKIRTPVMHEEFNDDSKLWIGDGSFDTTARIEDGMFQMNRSENSWYIDIPIHYVKDFEIEFRAKIDEKSKLYHWGGISYGDTICGMTGLHFTFANFNMVKLYGCQYGECEKKKIRHFVNNINGEKRTFNKYSIRKIDHYYYVFVNDVYEFTWPFMPLHGSRFTVSSNPESRVLFDYIKISYLQ